MQIVIKIPDNAYQGILNAHSANGDWGTDLIGVLCKGVAYGTPLPKGHKRLIEDDFEVGPVFDEEGNMAGYRYITQEDLNNAQTIVEADIEEDLVLDKVKAEIYDTLHVGALMYNELIDFRDGKISANDIIQEFNRITRIEVLRILDEYRASGKEKR